MPPNISLRRQLLRWLLGLLIPLVLLGGIIAAFWADHFSNLAYDRALLRATLALTDQIFVIDGEVVVNLPEKALELLDYDKDDVIYYRVTDPAGDTITGQADLPWPEKMPPPHAHVYYDAEMDGTPVRVAAYALPLTGTSAQGIALVQVAETTTKRDLLADDIIFAVMLPQVLLVLLAGALVYFGVRRGLAPLADLQRAVNQRSHRDLSMLPLEQAPSEVRPLLRAMNALLQRLQQSIAHQQRFTADASHQLRTPLAGIRTHAEMALREQDAARIRRELEWIQTGTLQLSHLVNQLLALSRVEPGSGREIAMQTLDLRELARDTTAEWVETALEKRIDLGFESAVETARVNGNAMLLRELLANLLDNAIRYSPPDSKVTVTLGATQGSVQLAVEDNGSGIPEAEREQVFERFRRLQDSAPGGSGLGLAIVREIALLHGAEIVAEPGANDHGTRMVLTLPLL
ncbi:MAG: sensor histidine kinase [Methylobacillus sp.]|jgi:two-component system sensor histidine kinase TctE|nr:sensor histidine kinase [Methylobacillus sp.]